jgi:sulfite reductase alpha subunit-like flavoprotein
MNQQFAQFLDTHFTVANLLLKYGPVLKNWDVQEFLTHVHVMAPRRYSIASSPTVDSKSIKLLVSEATFNHNGTTQWGLASHFVCQSPVATKLSIKTVPCQNGFRNPKLENTPIVMIGAGTGIASFLAFLDERKSRNWVSIAKGGQSKAILLFGSRTKDSLLVPEQLQEYLDSGVLDTLIQCYSRSPSRCKYVQDLVELDKSLLLKLILDENATIYVCGNDALRSGIKKAFDGILAGTKVSIDTLRASKRYNEDV